MARLSNAQLDDFFSRLELAYVQAEDPRQSPFAEKLQGKRFLDLSEQQPTVASLANLPTPHRLH